MIRIEILEVPLPSVREHLADYENLFVVCDRHVSGLAETLKLPAAGWKVIDANEERKTMETVLEIQRWLMNAGADRDAFLLGIGGGVTTDLTGFTASIYKRGIRFGFLPTTLLAQVDASIGGKNGVNLDDFKNMIGVIRQPEMTFLCPEVLETLPYRQFLSGAAELLKTFLIDNTDGHYEKAVDLLGQIHAATDPAAAIRSQTIPLRNLIAAAARIKAGVVQRDPDEHGERRILNLGHTFAHAIEKHSAGKIPHGEAVAIGIVLAARLSEAEGLARHGLAGQLTEDFQRCGLPVTCPCPVRELSEAMKKDKKAEGSFIHFVLPIEIGHVEIRNLSPEAVILALK